MFLTSLVLVIYLSYHLLTLVICVGNTQGQITKMELSNLFEYLKTEIIGTINSQLDTLKIKKKQEEEKVSLIIFCHFCSKKH